MLGNSILTLSSLLLSFVLAIERRRVEASAVMLPTEDDLHTNCLSKLQDRDEKVEMHVLSLVQTQSGKIGQHREGSGSSQREQCGWVESGSISTLQPRPGNQHPSAELQHPPRGPARPLFRQTWHYRSGPHSESWGVAWPFAKHRARLSDVPFQQCDYPWITAYFIASPS